MIILWSPWTVDGTAVPEIFTMSGVLQSPLMQRRGRGWPGAADYSSPRRNAFLFLVFVIFTAASLAVRRGESFYVTLARWEHSGTSISRTGRTIAASDHSTSLRKSVKVAMAG